MGKKAEQDAQPNQAESDAWVVGAKISIPPRYSRPHDVDGNQVSQLLDAGQDGTVHAVEAASARLDGDDRSEIEVRVNGPGASDYLRPKRLLTTSLMASNPDDLEWVSKQPPGDPDMVLRSWDGNVQLVLESKPAGNDGLRRPQVGAVHSVIGYWTAEPPQPATVVLPTGTGKTETMLALFAMERMQRLLVLVPSSALRDQLAGKFAAMGVLPGIGVLSGQFSYPAVGKLKHALKSTTSAVRFAEATNVVVATPQALNTFDPEIRKAFVDQFSHLFVDEAHHIRAATWESLRDSFEGKPVVQFTATPYREDQKPIGGRLVYEYPLRLAKKYNYFSPIRYHSVRSATGSLDHAIAETAVDQLRQDLDAGYDHVLMARVDTKDRANDVVKIYAQVAPDLEPRVLYSGLSAGQTNERIAALRGGQSRIVVCVDMLGEGFDLPKLKIAAIHDPHKSLGITLQFIGRFARPEDHVGAATVIVARPDTPFDERLRALYSEDADWEEVIEDLSDAVTADYRAWTEFDKGFGNQATEIAAYNVEPKMSTVVFQTRCDEWDPRAAGDHFGRDNLLVTPQINSTEGVCWFVRRLEGAPHWAPDTRLRDTTHELYAMHWDRERGLLYINSSNNDGPDRHHELLAQAVAGQDAVLIKGEAVYRAYAGIERLVPTNVGTLDARNAARKFAMHAGRNVEEGFPAAEEQTKLKTNVFAHGYDAGDRRSVGASLKGRVWEWRSGGSLQEWAAWCRSVGERLADENLDVDAIMRNFIRPVTLTERPPLVALAADWPWEVHALTTDTVQLEYQGQPKALIDSEIVLHPGATTGPIQFDVHTESWTAPYDVDFTERGMEIQPVQGEVWVAGRSRRTLSSYIQEHGLSIYMEGDAVIEHPGILVRPNRELDPFPSEQIQDTISWSTSDITVEVGPAPSGRRSVQETYLRHMKGQGWDVIVRDDGTGEAADLVGLRREGDFELSLSLVHCKASKQPTAGTRVKDLYEVCGQAQKSATRYRNLTHTMNHLLRRERKRNKRGATGIEHGSLGDLEKLSDEARLLQTELTIIVVQPGLSKARASRNALELLAATEVYVFEVGGGRFEIVGSP